MEKLYFLFISVIIINSVRGDGHFYLTIINGSDISVVEGNSQIDTSDIQWGAKSFYNSSINQTGWNILEVISNPDLDDDSQAYHAGWVEGFLTQKQIYYHWYNSLKSYCTNIPITCDNIKKYIHTNRIWINYKISSEDNDPYWHQVKLYYRQLEGLYDGYTNATLPDENLTYEDFVLLNFVTDIMTLQESLADKDEDKYIVKHGHCSVLIKLLPNYSDILFAHTAWIEYAFMNRLIKRYNFSYHLSGKSTKLIPGQSQAFSSYAGVITSLDDFYIIDSGLVVTETTLYIYNQTIYRYNKPNDQVLETVRSTVANRLSSSSAQWSKYFSKMNSGTYNNQWMVIDLKKFRKGEKPKEGLLQVVEQMPGLIESQDQTPNIVNNSYWASYNIPFYPNIFKHSGSDMQEKKYGFYYNHKTSPRGKIFARDHSKVVDVDSMIKAIRYNNYKTDPFSICPECDPKPNGCMSIASRCDLNPANGTYLLQDLKFEPYGGIDGKIGSYSMFKKGEMMAVGGPSQSEGVLPPFRWSTAQPNDMPHLGQPDLWDFSPILTSWMHSKDEIKTSKKATTIFTTSSKHEK